MNTRSPYGTMVQSQRMGGVQSRPMQYPQRPQPAAPPPQKKPAGMMGAMGGAMGSMMSDENSKREIKQLESANEALTKALSSKAEYPDTTSRSAGMQALGQQAVPPSRADFPDVPADAVADRVAAQNVALQQGQQAPQAAAPMAQPQQLGAPQQNPWGVQTTMPNLSDLDEAYSRMGRGG